MSEDGKDSVQTDSPQTLDLKDFSQQASDFADSCVRDSMESEQHLKKLEDAIRTLLAKIEKTKNSEVVSEQKKMTHNDYPKKILQALIRGHKISLSTACASLRWQCVAVNASESELSKYETIYSEKILKPEMYKSFSHVNSVVARMDASNDSVILLELEDGLRMDEYKDHLIQDTTNRLWRRVDVAQDVNMLCCNDHMLQIACLYVDHSFPICLLTKPKLENDGLTWWKLEGWSTAGSISQGEFLNRHSDLFRKNLMQTTDDGAQISVAAVKNDECIEILHSVARWHAHAIPFLLDTLFVDTPKCRDAYALLAYHRLLHNVIVRSQNIPHTLATVYAMGRFREDNLLPLSRAILKDELHILYSDITEQLLSIISRFVSYRNPDITLVKHVFDNFLGGETSAAVFNLETEYKIFMDPVIFEGFFGVRNHNLKPRDEYKKELVAAKTRHQKWQSKNSYQMLIKKPWKIIQLTKIPPQTMTEDDEAFLIELLKRSSDFQENTWLDCHESADPFLNKFCNALRQNNKKVEPRPDIFLLWAHDKTKKLYRQPNQDPLVIYMNPPSEDQARSRRLQALCKQFTPQTFVRIPPDNFQNSNDFWALKITNMEVKPLSVSIMDHLTQTHELDEYFDSEDKIDGAIESKWYAVPNKFWTHDQLVALSSGTNDNFHLTSSKTQKSNDMIWGNFKRAWVQPGQKNVYWYSDVELDEKDRLWWLQTVLREKCIGDSILTKQMGPNWANRWKIHNVINFGCPGERWRKSGSVRKKEEKLFDGYLPLHEMTSGFCFHEFYKMSDMNVVGVWAKANMWESEDKYKEILSNGKKIEKEKYKAFYSFLKESLQNRDEIFLDEQILWTGHGVTLSDFKCGDYFEEQDYAFVLMPGNKDVTADVGDIATVPMDRNRIRTLNDIQNDLNIIPKTWGRKVQKDDYFRLSKKSGESIKHTWVQVVEIVFFTDENARTRFENKTAGEKFFRQNVTLKMQSLKFWNFIKNPPNEARKFTDKYHSTNWYKKIQQGLKNFTGPKIFLAESTLRGVEIPRNVSKVYVNIKRDNSDEIDTYESENTPVYYTVDDETTCIKRMQDSTNTVLQARLSDLKNTKIEDTFDSFPIRALKQCVFVMQSLFCSVALLDLNLRSVAVLEWDMERVASLLQHYIDSRTVSETCFRASPGLLASTRLWLASDIGSAWYKNIFEVWLEDLLSDSVVSQKKQWSQNSVTSISVCDAVKQYLNYIFFQNYEVGSLLTNFVSFLRNFKKKNLELKTSNNAMTFACAARRCNVLRDLAADATQYLALQTKKQQLNMETASLEANIKARQKQARDLLVNAYLKIDQKCRSQEISQVVVSNAKSWYYVLELEKTSMQSAAHYMYCLLESCKSKEDILKNVQSVWSLNQESQLIRKMSSNIVSILSFVCPEKTEEFLNGMKDEFIKIQCEDNSDLVTINSDDTWGIEEYENYAAEWTESVPGIFEFLPYAIAVIVDSGYRKLKNKTHHIQRLTGEHVIKKKNNVEKVAAYKGDEVKSTSIFYEHVRPWIKYMSVAIDMMDTLMIHQQTMTSRIWGATQAVSARRMKFGGAAANTVVELSHAQRYFLHVLCFSINEVGMWDRSHAIQQKVEKEIDALRQKEKEIQTMKRSLKTNSGPNTESGTQNKKTGLDTPNAESTRADNEQDSEPQANAVGGGEGEEPAGDDSGVGVGEGEAPAGDGSGVGGGEGEEPAGDGSGVGGGEGEESDDDGTATAYEESLEEIRKNNSNSAYEVARRNNKVRKDHEDRSPRTKQETWKIREKTEEELQREFKHIVSSSIVSKHVKRLLKLQDAIDVYDKTRLADKDLQAIEGLSKSGEIKLSLTFKNIEDLVKIMEEHWVPRDNTNTETISTKKGRGLPKAPQKTFKGTAHKQLYYFMLSLRNVEWPEPDDEAKRELLIRPYTKKAANLLYDIWMQERDPEWCKKDEVWKKFEEFIGNGWVFKIACYNKISKILWNLQTMLEKEKEENEKASVSGPNHIVLQLITNFVNQWDNANYSAIIGSMWALYHSVRKIQDEHLLSEKGKKLVAIFEGGDAEVVEYMQKMVGPVLECMHQQINDLDENSIPTALESGHQLFLLYHKQCFWWNSKMAMQNITQTEIDGRAPDSGNWTQFDDEELMRECFRYMFNVMMKLDVKTPLEKYYETMESAKASSLFSDSERVLHEPMTSVEEEQLIKKFHSLALMTFSSAKDLVHTSDINSYKTELSRMGINIQALPAQVLNNFKNFFESPIATKADIQKDKEYWGAALKYSEHLSSIEDIKVSNCIQVLEPIFWQFNLSHRILELPRRMVLQGLAIDLFNIIRRNFKEDTEEYWREQANLIMHPEVAENDKSKEEPENYAKAVKTKDNDVQKVTKELSGKDKKELEEIGAKIPSNAQINTIVESMRKVQQCAVNQKDLLVEFQDKCTKFWDELVIWERTEMQNLPEQTMMSIEETLQGVKDSAEKFEDVLYFYIENFEWFPPQSKKQDDENTQPPQNSVLLLCLFSYAWQTHCKKLGPLLNEVRNAFENFVRSFAVIEEELLEGGIQPLLNSMEENLRKSEEFINELTGNVGDVHDDFYIAYRIGRLDVKGIEINNSVFLHYSMTNLVIPYLNKPIFIHPETRSFYENCIELLAKRAQNLASEEQFSDTFLGLQLDKPVTAVNSTGGGEEQMKEGEAKENKPLKAFLSIFHSKIKKKFGVFVKDLIVLEAFEYFREKSDYRALN